MSSKNSTIVENPEFVSRFIEALGTSEPAEVQQELDISYQAAKNYLHGRLPSADVLIRIANTCGVSLNWLLTGEGEKEITKTESDIEQAIRRIVREELANQSNIRFVDSLEKQVVDEWKMTDKDKEKSQRKKA